MFSPSPNIAVASFRVNVRGGGGVWKPLYRTDSEQDITHEAVIGQNRGLELLCNRKKLGG
jgi:hypothetical protein